MNGATCPLPVYVGLPLRYPLQAFQDPAGKVPVDLTGCTFDACMAPQAGGAVVPLAIEDVDLTVGKIAVIVTTEQSAALTEDHAWNLIITDTLGGKIVLRGAVERTGVVLPES